jgi:hypothetical protein
VDDFFTFDDAIPGELDTGVVAIEEPALGTPDIEGGDAGAIAYRVALTENYDEGSDLTMRMYFFRTGTPRPGDCLIFRLDSLRLANGEQVQLYGDRVWIRIDNPDTKLTTQASLADELLGEDGGLFLVIDLPLNTAGGLDFPDDVEVTDMLAFEVVTELQEDLGAWEDGARYELLGVEFFESEGGDVSGATIFRSLEELTCAGD